MDKSFLLSDASVNSYGFRIDMSKLSIERFLTNPVCLYNHSSLIGRWLNIQKDGDKLYGTPEFMDDETELEAKKVKTRVEKGFVKGASLGIHILSVTYPENDPPLVEAEVLECSIVDVPSNKNALRILSSEGIELTDEEIKTQLSAFKSEPLVPNTNSNMKLNANSLVILGLSDGASVTEIDTAIKALSDRNAALQTKIDESKQKQIDALLSGAVASGKILATEKENYALQAKENFDFVASVIEKLPAKSNLSGNTQGGKNDGDERADWSFEKWRKEDTPGLLSIKATDPDRYAEIIKK